MKPVFVDTSFYVAFLSPRDGLHDKAVHAMANDNRGMVTTGWVLLELGNMLAEGPYRTRFAPFVEELRMDSAVHIVPASEELFDAGVGLYREREDKEWSVTDCISFLVMGQLGLTDALTADHHFRQAGFNALLI